MKPASWSSIRYKVYDAAGIHNARQATALDALMDSNWRRVCESVTDVVWDVIRDSVSTRIRDVTGVVRRH